MTVDAAARWAEIDLEAIRHNVRQVARLVSPRTAVMAVVKANGYGHGAVPSARAALEGGATWADSPRAVAREGELILTSLPGPTEVEAVALGPDGIIHGAVPGSVPV